MYKKIIIIGAPRSGTNMLRNALVKLQGVETWSCDEINYIWRHGNKCFPSDEFTPKMARQRVKKFVSNEFDKFARSSSADVVVEKTCANAMRVGFVDQICPDAKYIFIVRDGIDVVGSAMLRWKAEMDIPYILKKMRYVPVMDLPYYASRYIGSQVHRFLSQDKRLSFWGPQTNDMDYLLKNFSLTQVCALQWLRCIENSERDFSAIDSSRVIRVQYEQFALNPLNEFTRIGRFIGRNITSEVGETLVSNISAHSIGKGRMSMTEKDRDGLKLLIGEKLLSYGYEC